MRVMFRDNTSFAGQFGNIRADGKFHTVDGIECVKIELEGGGEVFAGKGDFIAIEPTYLERRGFDSFAQFAKEVCRLSTEAAK